MRNNDIRVRKGSPMQCGGSTKEHFKQNDHCTSAGPRAVKSTRFDSKQQAITKPTVDISKDVSGTKTTYKFHIDKSFNSTVVAGWKIWVNYKDRIICSPIDRNDPVRKFRTFAFEIGTIHIVEDKARNTNTIFFRTDEFQDFLSNYGISKVLSKEPSGKYAVVFMNNPAGTKSTQNYIATDGKMAEVCSFAQTDDVIINMGRADRYFEITDASILVLDTYIDDGINIPNRVHRTLVTKLDLKTAADKLDTLLKCTNLL